METRLDWGLPDDNDTEKKGCKDWIEELQISIVNEGGNVKKSRNIWFVGGSV